MKHGPGSSPVLRLLLCLFVAHLISRHALRAQDAASRVSDSAAPADSQPADAGAAPGNDERPAPEPLQPAPVYQPVATEPSIFGSPRIGPIQQIPESQLGGVPQYGVPYSAVLQGQTIDPFSSHTFHEGGELDPKLGDLNASIFLGSGGIGLSGLPFLYHATEPQNAMVKIGPLFYRIDALTANLLYTDNYRLSATDRQSKLFAIITLNMTLIAQVSDDLQFAINGTLIYLPIQNVVGFVTSSLEGGLGFLLAAVPSLSAQVSYSALIAGWTVVFSDHLYTSTGAYSANTRDNFFLFNGGYLAQTRRGEYTFHPPSSDLRNNSSSGSFGSNSDAYFNFFANTVSASTVNYLPGDIGLAMRAYRSDFWYNGSNGNDGRPHSQEAFSAAAETNRPNMRFTLFASYQVSHVDGVPGVYQTAQAGLFGPLDDYLFLRASAGYYWSNNGHQGAVWEVSLDHDAGPTTHEQFVVSQSLSLFNDEVITSEYYRVSQVIGRTLNGSAFADHSDFSSTVRDHRFDRTQEAVGVDFAWALGPLTSLDLSGIYTHQHFTGGFTTDTWTGRIYLRRTISDTMFLTAFYQYQKYQTSLLNPGYYENLVFLSFVKYF